MGVKKISVRIHRPRSGRFADVPASLPRFCARIKEPAVGSKVLQNEEIRKKNHRSRCRRMLRRENSGPRFAPEKHRFRCRRLQRKQQLRVCKRNGRRRTSKSWKTVKNREATEHTSAGKSKFTSQIQVPVSLRKSIVSTADRCSSAKFRSKRAQT